jgi:tRNA pseudouridine32 synthase/23S rRNA pseudouridine746 synthase
MKRSPPLPVRDGVSPSFVWLPAGSWATLGAFFAQRFPAVEQRVWVARAARAEVRDDLGNPLALDSPYRVGACVFYYRELMDETPIPFEEQILFRNDQILVVDKPHFLPVIPGGRFLHESLLVRLKRSTGIETLVPIHRLDRETAGVMLFSIDPASRNLWQGLFRDRAIHKVYEALAGMDQSLVFPLTLRSRLVQDDRFFRMKEVDGEVNAETLISVLQVKDEHALYQLEPLTGKMHQLRVHMNSLGLPILNDGFYPHALPCKGDDFSSPLKLLARSLSFVDPVTGEARFFESVRHL